MGIPAAAISEAAFQTRILHLADLRCWLTYRTGDSRTSDEGWPDLVLCRPPQFLVVELKRETGKAKVSPGQQVWIDALTASDVDVRVIRPSGWDALAAVLDSPPTAGQRDFHRRYRQAQAESERRRSRRKRHAVR